MKTDDRHAPSKIIMKQCSPINALRCCIRNRRFSECKNHLKIKCLILQANATYYAYVKLNVTATLLRR